MHLKRDHYICGFTVIKCNMYLKELVGKWRFKAKYDSYAEKSESVYIEYWKRAPKRIGLTGTLRYSLGLCQAIRSGIVRGLQCNEKSPPNCLCAIDACCRKSQFIPDPILTPLSEQSICTLIKMFWRRGALKTIGTQGRGEEMPMRLV